MTPTAKSRRWESASTPPQGGFLLPWMMKERATMGFLIVFLGGGLGAALRHGVNLASARVLGTAFPYHTMIENVTGSIVMGLLTGYFAFHGGVSQHWRLFLTTGILGGYTTFSAFSLDAVLLYERGAFGLAALYVVGSVLLAIGGLFAGLALARHVL
jgi:CrcB protein